MGLANTVILLANLEACFWEFITYYKFDRDRKLHLSTRCGYFNIQQSIKPKTLVFTLTRELNLR